MPVSPPISPSSSAHSLPALDMIVTDTDGKQVIYNLGDMAWVIAAMALVFIMIPGVGYFYSGLLRRKNALSMIWASMLSIAVVSFQVRALAFFLPIFTTTLPSGFSGATRSHLLTTAVLLLAHSVRPLFLDPVTHPSNPRVEFFGLRNVLGQSAGRIPILLFCIYQLMFAAITQVYHFPILFVFK